MTVLGPNCIAVTGNLWRLQRWMREIGGYVSHQYVEAGLIRGDVYPLHGDWDEWENNYGPFLNDSFDDIRNNDQTFQDVIRDVVNDIVNQAYRTVWKGIDAGRRRRGTAMVSHQEVILTVQGYPMVRAVAGMEGQNDLRTLQDWMREEGIDRIGIFYTGMNGNSRIELSDIPSQARDISINDEHIADFAKHLATQILDGNFKRWDEDAGRVGTITITTDTADLEISYRSHREKTESADLLADPRGAAVHGIETAMKKHGFGRERVEIYFDTYREAHHLPRVFITRENGDRSYVSNNDIRKALGTPAFAIIDAFYPEWQGATNGNVRFDLSPGRAEMKVESYEDDFRRPFLIDLMPPALVVEAPEADDMPTP